MASVSESLRSGLGALTSFSSVLNEILGSIDGKVGDLSLSFDEVIEKVAKLADSVEQHENRLTTLETFDDHKSLAEAMSTMQASVENKLNDVTNQFHKEIVSQRALSRMDINALRGKITHSMSEAVSVLSELPRFSNFDLDPSSSPTQKIDYLIDRVKQLEEATNMQHTLNTHFSTALNTDDIENKIYDHLYEELCRLTSKNEEVKSENSQLRQQLKELNNVQREHERLIAELHQALVNNDRMEKLKSKISERKTFVAGLKGSKDRSQTTMSEPWRRKPNTDMMNEELIYGNHRKSNANLKPSDMLSGSLDEEDEGQEEEETPNGRSVRVTSSASPSRKSKSSAGHKHGRAKSIPLPISEADEVENDTEMEKRGGREGKIEEGNEGEKKEEAKKAMGEAKKADGEAKKVEEESTEAGGKVEGDSLKIIIKEGADEERAEQLSAAGELSPSDSFVDGSIFSENNSITDYYYGTDYTKKLMGALQTKQEETESELRELNGRFTDKLEELESTVNIFKRLALMIDDLKTGYEGLRQRVEAVAGSESLEEKLAQSLFGKIKRCKELWNKVHSEMIFGLDNIPEAEKDFIAGKDRPGQSEWPLSAAQIETQERDREQKLFFKLSLDLVALLDNTIEDFAPRETAEVTLKTLFPALLKIYDQAEVLLEMDNKARQSSSLDYCFDDIICSDLSTSLKKYVKEAVQSSMPLLDECLHKITLHKQMIKVFELLDNKAEKNFVHYSDQEVRSLLSEKVDHAEFIAVTSKLASSTEMKRVQAQITDRLSSKGGTGTHGSVFGSFAGDEAPPLMLTEQPDFISLQDRFTALSNKLVDLQQGQGELVSKEEVHEALKAIIGEVKNIRRNCVMLPVFKEGLRLKADAVELERLVKSMTQALGNINLTDFASSAAAVHAKCLLCDKPVSSQQRTRTASSSSKAVMSQSLPQLYEKGMETKPSSSKKNRLNSPQERLKVASEINILRSSMSTLPEITDVVDSPRAGQGAEGGRSSAQSNYSNRIRSSAGGGMGPGFAQDTR